MLVKDLIYLLQNKCKPDQEIMMSVALRMNDGGIAEMVSDISDSFYAVGPEDEEDDVSVIAASGEFGKNFLIEVLRQNIDIEKYVGGKFVDGKFIPSNEDAETPKKKRK